MVAKATSRKRLNHISYLIDDAGARIDNQEEMCKVVKEYYKGIFTSTGVNQNLQGMEDVRVVTSKHNVDLVAELSFEEFEVAIKQMHLDKASGPDGLNPAFFQHFWGLFGKDIFNCCKTWLKDLSFPANSMTLTWF